VREEPRIGAVKDSIDEGIMTVRLLLLFILVSVFTGSTSAEKAGGQRALQPLEGNQTTTPPPAPPAELIDELLAGQCAGSNEVLRACFLDALPKHTGVYPLQTLGERFGWFMGCSPADTLRVASCFNASGCCEEWGLHTALWNARLKQAMPTASACDFPKCNASFSHLAGESVDTTPPPAPPVASGATPPESLPPSTAAAAAAASSTPTPKDSAHALVLAMNLPYSASEFEEKQEAFTQAVAAAANIDVAQVSILSVTERSTPTSRRAEAVSVDVRTELRAESEAAKTRLASSLTEEALNAQLAASGLAQGSLVQIDIEREEEEEEGEEEGAASSAPRPRRLLSLSLPLGPRSFSSLSGSAFLAGLLLSLSAWRR